MIKKMKWFKKKNLPLPKEHICCNCGTQTVGKYCHECGQNVFAGKEQPILHLFGQMLENAFSLDAKAPRTLAFLMFRPGFLSTEYRAGRISRYVHPVKLFWMATLILFALMIYQLGANKNVAINNQEYKGKIVDINFDKKEVSNYATSDTLHVPSMNSSADVEKPKENHEQLFINFLSKYAPYISFLFIPLFALLLALFFWRNKYYYISHLIFTVHFHTFLWIFWSLLMLIDILTPHWKYPNWLSLLLFILPGIYFAIALHRFYKTKSRWQSVWKAILILLLYFIIFLTVVVFLIILMEKLNFFHGGY
ncbi:MAG: DUF3667 domain-containing protein [Bacteroidetes bacterium]|nr:DUF3667 domain-containing protein [Bacteroidota bacterium]MCL1968730.1 DUF3667 domain-containing protein [Bacteroidota bacterium]